MDLTSFLNHKLKVTPRCFINKYLAKQIAIMITPFITLTVTTVHSLWTTTSLFKQQQQQTPLWRPHSFNSGNHISISTSRHWSKSSLPTCSLYSLRYNDFSGICGYKCLQLLTPSKKKKLISRRFAHDDVIVAVMLVFWRSQMPTTSKKESACCCMKCANVGGDQAEICARFL